jgi:hypothetical protein
MERLSSAGLEDITILTYSAIPPLKKHLGRTAEMIKL